MLGTTPIFYMFLALSAFCTCFNGIQPVAICGWLQPLFLLQCLHSVRLVEGKSWQLAFVSMVTVTVQTLATLVAYQDSIGLASVPITLGFALVATMVNMIPYVVNVTFRTRFPKAWLSHPLTFACTWTSTWYVWNRLSWYAGIMSPSNAQHSIPPLVLTSQLWGIDGINFLIGYFAGVANDRYLIKESKQVSTREIQQHKLQLRAFAALFVLSFFYGGLQLAPLGGNLIKKTAKPMLQASCIVAKVFPEYETAEAMLNRTQARIEAGDKIIIWSEGGVFVNGRQAEEKILLETGNLIKQAKNKQGGPYVGVTYDFFDDVRNASFNIFALLLPNGSLGFRYKKVHLVPFVEDDVTPGESFIPVVDTEYGYIGGAICFDFEFPDFIRSQKVDIMLQPVQTWGRTGVLLYRSDMFRAIENGFTLFRCASEGISGVMDPLGQVLEYREEASSIVLPMELPVPWKRIRTLYADFGGFVLPWFTMVVALAHILMAWLPLSIGHWVLGNAPHVFVVYFTGDSTTPCLPVNSAIQEANVPLLDEHLA